MTDRPCPPTARPPRWHRSIEALTEDFRSRDYIADRSLATAVFLALELGRPLLLEGEAGVGKTELAKVLAASLGARLIRLQCYEGLDVNTAVYEWNYPRQMLEIRLLEARGEAGPGDRARHLRHGVPDPPPAAPGPRVQRRHRAGAADRRDRPRRRGVRGLPARDPVRLPGHGPRDRHDPRRAPAARDPHVEPDPRGPRRAQAPLPLPLDRLPDGRRRNTRSCSPAYPAAPERLAREVVGFVHRLREADLTKVPGIAETLDWAAALLALGARELTPELVDETLGVVLKYEEDIRAIRGEQTARDTSPRSRPAAERMDPRLDPAVVKAPWGAEVDGRRLLQETRRVRAGAAGRRAARRPRRGGRLRTRPAARRHRRARAGPGRGRGDLRPPPRRPRDLRRGLRPVVAPARPDARASSRRHRSGARRRPATTGPSEAGGDRSRRRATSATEPAPTSAACRSRRTATTTRTTRRSRASSSRPTPTRAASCSATGSSTG